METDALYAVISRRSTRLPGVDAAASVLAVSAAAAAALRSDYCTPRELQSYGDREDMVIVTKRDPESASPVKVASMDYVIPEKAPQPSNVLESLVWEREREVDRQRERFQLARALSLAKASQGKYRKRDFFDLILQAKAKASSAANSASKPVLVEFARDSLYNGRLGGPEGSLYSPDEALGQVRRFGQEMRTLLGAQGAAGAPVLGALGINVDFGTFRGSYEDVEELRRATDAGAAAGVEIPDLPIMCSDFVVYAYQLFRAKSSGADAVKLMASVLSVQGT
jgi:indole-3-glycerol phosphate synthase